jgi:hypothetical protein
MKISIGRASDNQIIVQDKHVSSHHAELLQEEDGSWYIIDLNSTNGTMVNGTPVIRKKITQEDRIVLAHSFELDIKAALKSDNDFSEEFSGLKEVYMNYQNEKIRIQSGNIVSSGLKRSLPYALPGVVGVIVSLGIKHPAMIVISVIVSIGAPVIGMALANKESSKVPEKLERLKDRFKIDYVCPKCGIFLGELPWENHIKRKKCQCGAKWTKYQNNLSNPKPKHYE